MSYFQRILVNTLTFISLAVLFSCDGPCEQYLDGRPCQLRIICVEHVCQTDFDDPVPALYISHIGIVYVCYQCSDS